MRRSFGYGLIGFGAIDRARYGAGGLQAAEYAEAGIPAGYTPNTAAALDYQQRYPDLAAGSDAATYWRHFINYGYYEGRRWDFTKGVTPAPAPVVVTPLPAPVITPLPAPGSGDVSTIFGIPSTYLLIGAAAFLFLRGRK